MNPESAAGGSLGLEAAVARAAALLASGSVVGVPTETLFGLAAVASDPEALAALWRAKQTEASPLAWHVPTAATAKEVIRRHRTLAPAHERLIDRLCPGPLMLAIELDEAQRSGVHEATGVAPGVIDGKQGLLLRVPAHEALGQVLRRVEGPVVVASVPVPGKPPLGFEDARAVLARDDISPHVDALLEASPEPRGTRSTLVRLDARGGYTVLRAGAYEERYITQRIERLVLFVCTGNTCRSPMAEAIARQKIAERGEAFGGGVPTRVASAGAFAGEGVPATPEAVDAVREMNVEMPAHASRGLTRAMLDEADVIFALTSSHLDAVLVINPDVADRVMLLDPDGGDVPDPIGFPAEVYRETARLIAKLVDLRLDQLDRGRLQPEGPRV